jgi:hypothetical protein
VLWTFPKEKISISLDFSNPSNCHDKIPVYKEREREREREKQAAHTVK